MAKKKKKNAIKKRRRRRHNPFKDKMKSAGKKAITAGKAAARRTKKWYDEGGRDQIISVSKKAGRAAARKIQSMRDKGTRKRIHRRRNPAIRPKVCSPRRNPIADSLAEMGLSYAYTKPRRRGNCGTLRRRFNPIADSLTEMGLSYTYTKPRRGNPDCSWCAATDDCDCADRISCPEAGEFGHTMCGTHSCGCPKFVHPQTGELKNKWCKQGKPGKRRRNPIGPIPGWHEHLGIQFQDRPQDFAGARYKLGQKVSVLRSSGEVSEGQIAFIHNLGSTFSYIVVVGTSPRTGKPRAKTLTEEDLNQVNGSALRRNPGWSFKRGTATPHDQEFNRMYPRQAKKRLPRRRRNPSHTACPNCGDYGFNVDFCNDCGYEETFDDYGWDIPREDAHRRNPSTTCQNCGKGNRSGKEICWGCGFDLGATPEARMARTSKRSWGDRGSLF
jgi:hypothetical protein